MLRNVTQEIRSFGRGGGGGWPGRDEGLITNTGTLSSLPSFHLVLLDPVHSAHDKNLKACLGEFKILIQVLLYGEQ